MKLNRVEKALMNNPVRALVQRHYEAALMQQIGGRVSGDVCWRSGADEVSVLRSYLNGLARARFTRLMDPNMITLARSRLSGFPYDRLHLFVGDAAAIEAEDGTFDAVFDFGMIHHIPDWRKAVREVVRVLHPGGRFFFEEVTQQALARWFYRRFLDHPKLDRFSAREFVDELQEQGIMVGENAKTWFFGDFVIGVGYKASKTLVSFGEKEK